MNEDIDQRYKKIEEQNQQKRSDSFKNFSFNSNNESDRIVIIDKPVSSHSPELQVGSYISHQYQEREEEHIYIGNNTNNISSHYVVRNYTNLTFQPTFEWKSGVFNNVTKYEFDNFINELNHVGETIIDINYFKNKLHNDKKYQKLFSILAILSISFSISFIILCFFLYKNLKLLYILILCAMFFLIIFFPFLFLSNSNFGGKNPEEIHHELSKILLNKRSLFERVIKKWNKEIFRPNGIFITFSRNLSFIKFHVE
jgi:hypothetical protein